MQPESFPFPMDRLSDATAWTLPLHFGLLLLVVLPFVFIFRQSRRLAKTRDGYLLLVALVTAPIVLIPFGLSIHPDLRSFVFGYAVIFELAVSLSLSITIYRLHRQQQASGPVLLLGSLLLLGIAVVLLLPSVPAAREAARRMQCSNNLKQLSVTLLDSESDQGHLPQLRVETEYGSLVSWRVELLPYLLRSELYEQYDMQSEWSSVANSEIARVQVATYVCPSSPFPQDADGRFRTSYAMVDGPGTALGTDSPRRFSEVASQSTTLAIVEACGRNIVWTEPRDTWLGPESLGINLNGNRPHTSAGLLSSYHAGGANAATLDGSVQFLSEKIDAQVLKRLAEEGPVDNW